MSDDDDTDSLEDHDRDCDLHDGGPRSECTCDSDAAADIAFDRREIAASVARQR